MEVDDFEMNLWADVLRSLIASTGEIDRAVDGADKALTAFRKARKG